MMRLRCDFHSSALGLATSMTVLLPQRDAAGQIGMGGGVRDGGTPVLYLLHGLSDDDTIWGRRTSIERYVSDLGLAVVMPQVHRSFYSDVVGGDGNYWQFIADELPQLVADSFQVSTRREDTFVAGLSMGGYGAMKLALNRPDRFAAAGSLSGALDILELAASGRRQTVMDTVFGDAGPGPESDLIRLCTTTGERDLPKLWSTCGTEDGLIEHQRRFVSVAAENGIEVTADEHPGAHSWDFWDTHIQRFLAWLPLR